ncbi:symmetrical bis(5'-nucleosyl)-tetraphosphatase [Ottowia thiooxydans]|uniref:symmetrical bis(5'-nucleosyl)-tetraphosphatase n=1 Tax=Ottowia thiooxydans TaxID=219182 RepID=UPI00048FA9E8|nr:symmetrical bis(5'-nucleosyl)-tetraphosphatase [Ottowia thiooxydans]
MALYMIGDVQGCDAALGRLLDEIAFSPSRDRIVLLGDLVNRGPVSLGVLHRLMALGDAAHCLLGNHDLHLLAVANGVRKLHKGDTVADILQSPQRDALLDWLRSRPLAWREHGVLMVHAGVLPQWSADQVLALAGEVEAVLRGDDWGAFMHQMYGNQPNQWHDELQGADRLRVIVNALTRLRYCTPDGRMEFETKAGGAQDAPPGHLPWFDIPNRKTANDVVAFGHWSTLGWVNRPDILSLDTGCVWGGCLSAVRLGRGAQERELIQVRCEQARVPGARV